MEEKIIKQYRIEYEAIKHLRFNALLYDEMIDNSPHIRLIINCINDMLSLIEDNNKQCLGHDKNGGNIK